MPLPAGIHVRSATDADLDGVVLLVGCDKTTPALLMGAASCDLPTIVLSGGPMLNGHYKGEEIGSGTDVWRYSEDVRAGRMTLAELTIEADRHQGARDDEEPGENNTTNLDPV